jgi:hypothetical protein
MVRIQIYSAAVTVGRPVTLLGRISDNAEQIVSFRGGTIQ